MEALEETLVRYRVPAKPSRVRADDRLLPRRDDGGVMDVDRTWFAGRHRRAPRRDAAGGRRHGVEETPLVRDDAGCLPILVEELGEVARAMTYDNGDIEKLMAELLQTAAMALAWHQRLADT
ncbi:MAG: hypothetical protein IPK85_03040 [Gemmatimonadetes bacterium]|nr:hypothetical protein [Gemmatimonadota bacterium]